MGMEQKVTVVEVHGSTARVRAVRASACGHCAGQSACGTMGSWVQRYAEMEVDNPINAHAGDEVIIDVPDGALLKATFRLYGVPMLAFIGIGLLVRTWAAQLNASAPDVWAALAGLLGMLTWYGWIWLHSQQAGHPSGRIIRIEHQGVIPIRAL